MDQALKSQIASVVQTCVDFGTRLNPCTRYTDDTDSQVMGKWRMIDTFIQFWLRFRKTKLYRYNDA